MKNMLYHTVRHNQKQCIANLFWKIFIKQSRLARIVCKMKTKFEIVTSELLSFLASNLLTVIYLAAFRFSMANNICFYFWSFCFSFRNYFGQVYLWQRLDDCCEKMCFASHVATFLGHWYSYHIFEFLFLWKKKFINTAIATAVNVLVNISIIVSVKIHISHGVWVF